MQTTKRITLLLLVICVFLFSTASAYAQGGITLYLPTVSNTDQTDEVTPHAGELIADQYIVVFSDDLVTSASVSAIATEIAATYGGEVTDTYGDVIKGFAMKFPAGMGASAVASLSHDARVGLVEQDRIVTIADTDSDTNSNIDAVNTIQSNPTWGLDRIDQSILPLNGTFVYNNTGAGVRAYIVDTGIYTYHSEFEGRATVGYSAFKPQHTDTGDCNGHGTHVAGTVGGKTYGVAKAVQLIAVRVLNCSGSGTTSVLLAGMNWIYQQHANEPTIPSVVNMSLGFNGVVKSVDDALSNSINSGIIYVVAAGNNGHNACNDSPGSAPSAITVGATDPTDSRPSWSNFGPCLDLFAPGVNIQSAWIDTKRMPFESATSILTGTSMAAAHVTGVVAQYLQIKPTASPSMVSNDLKNIASPGVVINPGTDSPNSLVHSS